MDQKKRRVRFAPSPTGPLHMGGVRTALYNYLFAKQAGGDFILRIEDTDSNRFVPGAEKYIIDSLRWCGIYPDEGVDAEGNLVSVPSERHPHAPYRQSERKPIYRKYAQQLIDAGWAYYAFDSAEELDAKRKEAEANKQTFSYNHASRNSLKNSLTLPEDEVKKLLETTDNWTIRFKNPENRTVEMDDMIRGHISMNTNTLDDKVLWKAADQLPTYHLANIVDDHLMEITHVIRGEEWLPSLPLHYLLYEAFGWADTQPRFAHLSLLLKPDGKGKLSKRDGDRLGFPVFPLRWVNAQGEVSRGYREDGYYPQAFINMLALLGWNPGTEQEIFTLEELTQLFSMEKVVKSGARFNPEKAKWFNQEYLRMRSNEQLACEFEELLRSFTCDRERDLTHAELTELSGLIKERAHFITDFLTICPYIFAAPTQYDEKDTRKFWTDEAKAIMPQVIARIESIDCKYTVDCPEHLPAAEAVPQIEESLTSLITENGWKMGAVMNALRLFFVGQAKGLGIADIIYYLGRKEALRRIRKAVETL